MSEVRFGPVMGDYKTIGHPVTDSQKFHPNGASFVYMDTSGYVTVAATDQATLFGWALVPRSLKGTDLTNGYWTSGASAAAGTSYVPVIVAAMNLHVVFRVPLYAAATEPAIQARCGEGCAVRTETSGTYIQTADLATGTTVLTLLVVGLPEDGDTTSILVCFSPLLVQTENTKS